MRTAYRLPLLLSSLSMLGLGCQAPDPQCPAAPPPPAPPASAPPAKPTASSQVQLVEELLSMLTLDEKIALVQGSGWMDTAGVPRLGIPGLHMADGPLGVRDGKSTGFPSGPALAASFDPGLIERVGAAIGEEAKAKGKNVQLGPCVNIARTPFGGRNFESYGEDPFLASRMTVGFIRGVQSRGVAATVKHFAVNNQETERLTISAVVDERTLHEIYFPTFEAAVKDAGVLAVMCAYNKINGTYACENPELLTKVLEERWGFRGLVMSDWDATHSTAPSMLAGLHLEMPKSAYLTPEAVKKAMAPASGPAVPESRIDEMVRRQLRLLAQLGLLDAGPSATLAKKRAQESTDHRAINREASTAGVVLLKNEGGILPLDKGKLKHVALIGPRAAFVDQGGGSAQIDMTYGVSLVSGLKEALGEKVVEYAPGAFTPEALTLIPASALTPPPGEGQGHGLLGEYFVGTERSGTPKVRRVDSTIDFRWDLASPMPELPVDNFSILWRGTLTAPESGRYRFGLTSDDGSRLYLDGKLVVDNWGQHPPTLKTGDIELEAGKPHELRLEYYETILGASVNLKLAKLGGDLLDQAKNAIKKADTVIVYAADTFRDETEGEDRKTLELPGNQADLVQLALASKKPTVVVVGSGGPVVGDWVAKAPVLVQSWFGGQESGHAITDVLLGVANPGGKLPMTFPTRVEDSASHGNFPGAKGEVHYAEGLLVGYRFFDAKGIKPAFPFGHGLSYTTFGYRDLKVTPKAGGAEVQVAVKNTGNRRGSETVQVYLHEVSPKQPGAEQALAGFMKVELSPGEERVLEIPIAPRAFAHFDTGTHDWVNNPGEFEVRVGSSSRDVRVRGSLKHE